LKLIQGNFGADAPTGKNKIQKALKNFSDSGIDIDDAGFVMILDLDGELKVASDLQVENLIFMLDVIKLSVLTGSYEV